MVAILELVGIAAAVLFATTVAHILESQNEKTFKSLNEVNDDTLVKVVRDIMCAKSLARILLLATLSC